MQCTVGCRTVGCRMLYCGVNMGPVWPTRPADKRTACGHDMCPEQAQKMSRSTHMVCVEGHTQYAQRTLGALELTENVPSNTYGVCWRTYSGDIHSRSSHTTCAHVDTTCVVTTITWPSTPEPLPPPAGPSTASGSAPSTQLPRLHGSTPSGRRRSRAGTSATPALRADASGGR